MKVIETERLYIRPLQPEDARPLAALWADPEVTRYMGRARHFDTLLEWFTEDAQASEPPVIDLWPVIEKASGKLIGHCGLTDKEIEGRTEIELVYVLATSAWGQGYASEAAAALRDYAFQDLRLPHLVALIDPQNVASARVAQKTGLRLEQEVVRPGGQRMQVYGLDNPAAPDPVIVRGEKVMLRDRLPADLSRFLYWQTHGQWRLLDAPWEGIDETLSEEEEDQLRQQFFKTCFETQPHPRKSAIIALPDGRPLGWINRYGEKYESDWAVGLDICEDEHLDGGLGSEALRLWVDTLFSQSSVHRIGLSTWSFNPRMMRVAEKVGFQPEGMRREMRQWQGEWLDLVHYGLLRREWESGR